MLRIVLLALRPLLPASHEQQDEYEGGDEPRGRATVHRKSGGATVFGRAFALTWVDRLRDRRNQMLNYRASNDRRTRERICTMLRIPRVVGKMKLIENIDIL